MINHDLTSQKPACLLNSTRDKFQRLLYLIFLPLTYPLPKDNICIHFKINKLTKRNSICDHRYKKPRNDSLLHIKLKKKSALSSQMTFKPCQYPNHSLPVPHADICSCNNLVLLVVTQFSPTASYILTGNGLCPSLSAQRTQ